MSDHLISIKDLKPLSQVTERFVQFADDYILCQITDRSPIKSKESTTRFSGLSFCLVTDGSAHGEIDTEPIDLVEGSLMVFSRWNSIQFDHKDTHDFRAEVLLVSEEFIHDVNIDLNALNMHSLFDSKPKPVMDKLTDTEYQMIHDIFMLLRHNAEFASETVYTRNIGRSALQCLIYLLLQIHALHHNPEEKGASQNRQIGYTQEFMQLLQLHHTRHRNIAFYADKLHISPKYLSHIIKETTGKSASDWIGEFVVREAKNMLRFTNKNVQQVAYALNFSTQSSFGKFFKHITGLSPSEFQKS